MRKKIDVQQIVVGNSTKWFQSQIKDFDCNFSFLKDKSVWLVIVNEQGRRVKKAYWWNQ